MEALASGILQSISHQLLTSRRVHLLISLAAYGDFAYASCAHAVSHWCVLREPLIEYIHRWKVAVILLTLCLIGNFSQPIISDVEILVYSHTNLVISSSSSSIAVVETTRSGRHTYAPFFWYKHSSGLEATHRLL